MMKNMFKQLNEWREERELQNNAGNYQANLAEELTELLRAETIDDEIDAMADMIVFAINAIEAKGYDAELVMDEVIKEISSRTGAHNKAMNKWVKFKTPEAMSLWYKADFTKCIK
jgi:hypothetical protein